MPLTIVSALCFLGGAAFAYYVVFPPAFRFMVGYSTDMLVSMPVVSEYFSLALRLLIAFGIIFELPVFLVMLARLSIIDSKLLSRNRRYAILIGFILAAVLTPSSDIISQLLMAGPLIILYEISIHLVKFFGGERQKESLENA